MVTHCHTWSYLSEPYLSSNSTSNPKLYYSPEDASGTMAVVTGIRLLGPAALRLGFPTCQNGKIVKNACVICHSDFAGQIPGDLLSYVVSLELFYSCGQGNTSNLITGDREFFRQN